MLRLFFALWPDEEVRAQIHNFASSLSLPNARLLPQHNTHVTLTFLGNVEPTTVTDLIDGAGEMAMQPFSLVLDGLAWWQKPKIACLTPSSYPEQLPALANQLHALSLSCGVPLQERAYQPHMTLARKVTSALPDISPQPISWNIKEFCLLESVAVDSGVKYQVKVSWPLKIM
jgi:RNA 2',3'-cyclic 3'-phosphodiesterase